MAKKSKFKAGDRVWFKRAGDRVDQEGAVVRVRKDGSLIVAFDADPPSPSLRMRLGATLVVQPYEVDPISTKEPRRHHATKKSPAQLQREIDEALSRRSAPRHHHATRKASAAAWDVAMDAILENDPAKAARIVAAIRKEHKTPSYAAITMDATPEFANALDGSPANVQERFFKSLDVRTSGFYQDSPAAVLRARRTKQPIRHAFVGDERATFTFNDGSTSTGDVSNPHVQELLRRAKREGAEIET